MTRAPAPLLALAMLALGAAQTPAFVHGSLWPLPWLAMAGLVWAIDGAGVRRAALYGWAYGTGWLAAGTAWLYTSMHRYGGLPGWMAAVAVVALAALLSLYLGAACAAWAAARTPARRTTLRAAVRFAAVWLLAEWARAVWFTGFPWISVGYSQVDAPAAVLAPWIGVHGIGAVMAFGAVLLRRALAGAAGRDRLHAAAPAAVLAALLAVAALLGPGQWTRSTGALSMSLLQTGLAQDRKFDFEQLPETLEDLSRAIAAAPGRVVVAPETAIPLLPEQVQAIAPQWWKALQGRFVAGGPQVLMTGVPLGDPQAGFTNSVAGWGSGAAYRYDKHHLVPFGEFIPTGFRWFTQMMHIPLGDFARGVAVAPSFAVDAQRLGVNICYEDLFGEELARRFVGDGDSPTILVNISNLAWFGDSWALAQHLAISRMRALELQRPMVRATNTGMTASIDHAGRVRAMLAPVRAGRLDVSVDGRAGTTPYAAWMGRTGWWLPVALALLALALDRRDAARRQSAVHEGAP